MSVLETVLHSTLDKSRKKLFFASLRSNALMAWAFSKSRIEFEDGGRNIQNPITLGRNPNIASYEYFQALPVAQTDEFDTVEYNWARVAGSVIISDQEQDENKGTSAIFKLLKAKMDVLEESVKEKFGEYLYGSGTGSDPNGLAALIPDDPTTGTLGTINRATETQWRTSSYDFSSSPIDSTTIEEALDDVLLDITLRKESPDIILMGRNLYRIYRQAVRDKLMISMPLGSSTNGKRMVDLGFGGMQHQNIPIVYDEDCGVNKVYLVNSKYLKLHILKHVNMKVKKLVAPWNIDAVGRRVVWQGQWCLWKAFRTHAVINNA